MDAVTLREYADPGACNPDTGGCEYDFADRTCATGCSDGACTSSNPCDGVVCDQPPPSVCQNESFLREFDAVGVCQPASGECEYGWTDRPCTDRCTAGQCVTEELGDDYGLRIPAGTRACSDKRSTWDVFGGYRQKMRITFREGLVRLPVDEASFVRDWIESIEHGPERTPLVPAGEGVFTRLPDVDRVAFEFVQDFASASETYSLRYAIAFAAGAVTPEERLQVFDESYLTPPETYGSIALDLTVSEPAGGTWYFITCDFSLYLPVVHRVETEDGGELMLDERYLFTDACMLACPTAFKRARWRRDQDSREVDDPFRLSFVDGQHNWFDQFLVVFDDPAGSIHGLYFFPADNDVPEPVVHYLDENQDPAASSRVVSHDTVELWAAFDAREVAFSTCRAYCEDFLGLADTCEAACPVEELLLSGRCLATNEPDAEWIDPGGCDQAFDACIQAGFPYIQCCCSRSAGVW